MVGGTKASQGSAKRDWIQEIGDDGADALDIARRTPCEPKHLPAAIFEAAAEIIADGRWLRPQALCLSLPSPPVV
jgi:hypothetical protein